MDPFTWFLIIVGVVIVGGGVWQAVRKSSRGVDEFEASRVRGNARGEAELYRGHHNHGHDGGPYGPG
jgi:hypothetical protein